MHTPSLTRCAQLLLLAAALVAPAAGLFARAPQPALLDATDAWDRGDYPAALRTFLALLDRPDADALLEAIASTTGELFTTVELTADGDHPRFSPDGRYLSYEIGRGGTRRTRLAATTAPHESLAELPGYTAAFSPDGNRLVYLRPDATPGVGAPQAHGAAAAERVVLRELAAGRERDIGPAGPGTTALVLGRDDVVLYAGTYGDGSQQIFRHQGEAPAAALTNGPGKVLLGVDNSGRFALFTERASNGGTRFGFVALPAGPVTLVDGYAPSFSAGGDAVAHIIRSAQGYQLALTETAPPHRRAIVRSGPEPLDNPAISPDGGRVVFQMMPREDWELMLVDRDGRNERRLTREIQHDVMPRFLSDGRLIGMVGESRHRRSYLYDVETGARIRLFHNNTIRTIAPEYRWTASPDGTKLLIVAERDGDTVSPERGVYLVDLARRVTVDEVRGRLRASLEAEEALRAATHRLFAPLADRVRQALDSASVSRVFGYQQRLFEFDSKHISQPGNRRAAEYLFETYRSFGYDPEYQTLAHPEALGGETANVLATLRGTVNPELVYVVSSHYDSVEESPGADDNTSGTAALLEAARILAPRPQPATIVFASFTGEESGLLGSREFVRRAQAARMRIAGAVNNDMIGWANDHRLDSTIRYSNPGIRDVQHGAAIWFTRLLTYDARYYKNTDAHAYYEAYGDIVGGFGAYPILGSPHYHRPHDVLETINHELVTEVAKATAATLMFLASSPSRLQGLQVDGYRRGVATLSWNPSPERRVTGYLVRWEAPGAAAQERRVGVPSVSLGVPPGTWVLVKGVDENGVEGWDWARTRID